MDKKPYEKPSTEIVNLELEQPILGASNIGDGGYWG